MLARSVSVRSTPSRSRLVVLAHCAICSPSDEKAAHTSIHKPCSQALHGAQTQVLRRFCPFVNSFRISLQGDPRIEPRRQAV